MGKYTVLEDAEANATVQSVLDKVVYQVRALLGQALQAIVLVGSYGRGEGGVYRRNGEYKLVNDLDLLLFVNGSLRTAKSRFQEPLEHLAHDLLIDGRGLKEIDLHLTHVRRYRSFVPNTVGNYEMAMGHQVIYGDLDLKQVMPTFDAARLPVYEGTNYLRNRGSGLLIPALYLLNHGLKHSEKRKNFKIELQKACQAMGDACLLMTRRYHFSYRERLDRFRHLDRDALAIPCGLFSRVDSLYEWGVSNKLRPSFGWPGDQEMISRWFEVRDTFGEFFLWFESKRLDRNFEGWGEYSKHVRVHGAGEPLDLRMRSAAGRVLSFLQGNGDEMSLIRRHRQCLATMPALLSALSPELGVDSSLISPAVVLLKQPGSKVDLAVWKSLVSQYLLTYYPTIVIEDALSEQ